MTEIDDREDKPTPEERWMRNADKAAKIGGASIDYEEEEKKARRNTD